MAIYTRATSTKGKSKALASISMKMERNMRGSGRTTKRMEKEPIKSQKMRGYRATGWTTNTSQGTSPVQRKECSSQHQRDDIYWHALINFDGKININS